MRRDNRIDEAIKKAVAKTIHRYINEDVLGNDWREKEEGSQEVFNNYEPFKKQDQEQHDASITGEKTTDPTVYESRRMVKESVDGGWEVDTSEVNEAYELAAQHWGNDDLNQQIVRCLSDETLAKCLAYIFRMNEFKPWVQYQMERE